MKNPIKKFPTRHNEPPVVETKNEAVQRGYRAGKRVKWTQLIIWSLILMTLSAMGGMTYGLKTPVGITEARLLEENKQLTVEKESLARQYNNCMWGRTERDIALGKI